MPGAGTSTPGDSGGFNDSALCHELAVSLGGWVVEQARHDPLEVCLGIPHLIQGDPGRPIGGIAVNSRRDGGERDGSYIRVGSRQVKHAAVRSAKEIRFAARPALPHWPNGVDHISGGQSVAAGQNGRTRSKAWGSLALFQQLGARGPVVGAIHPSPATESFVCRVDDGVGGEGGDVGDEDLDHELPRWFRSPSSICRVSQSVEWMYVPFMPRVSKTLYVC